MNRFPIIVLVAFAILGAACSSGSGGDPVISPGFAAAFLADAPNPPGSETVSAHQGPQVGSQVTIEIRVTGTNDIYGATFDLNFDPSMATFVDFAEGSLLEQGGHSPDYVVEQPQSGQLIVVVTRVGNVPGVNASGETLIGLTFEVIEEGSSIVSLTAHELLDGQLSPQPIPNLTWFGGALAGT